MEFQPSDHAGHQMTDGFEIDRTLSVYYGMWPDEDLCCTVCNRKSHAFYWVHDDMDDLRCIGCTQKPADFKDVRLVAVRGLRFYIILQ